MVAMVHAVATYREEGKRMQLSDLTSRNMTLQHQIDEAEERMSNLKRRYDETAEKLQTEKQSRIDETRNYTTSNHIHGA